MRESQPEFQCKQLQCNVMTSVGFASCLAGSGATDDKMIGIRRRLDGGLILVIWVISRKEAQGNAKVPGCSNLMPAGHQLSIDGKTKSSMGHVTVVCPQEYCGHNTLYLGP